jgi:sortase (surface protein transpeptidase)
MAFSDQLESNKFGSGRANRVAWLIALACAVALISGVVAYSVMDASRLTAPAASSGASESTSLPPLPWTRRAETDAIRSTSLKGHILIPAIEVDAPLIPLGLAENRALEVPKKWGEAGWFKGGPFPGEPGPAVVAGHVDSTSGPAVFYRLRELERGDVIVVWREGDIRSRFRVESLKWFPKSAFPTELVYRSTPGPALRLITCGGAFDNTSGHYVDNLVVFASPFIDS